MLIKTLLNKVERFKSFVYGSICVLLVGGTEALIIDFVPRRKVGHGALSVASDAQSMIDSQHGSLSIFAGLVV